MKKVLMMGSIFAMFAFTVADWKRVELDSKVSVAMPTDPVDEKLANGMIRKVAKTADGTEFKGMVVDYAKFGVTEEKMKEMIETDQMAQQIKGSLEQQGGKVIKMDKGEYKKYTYYDCIAEIQKQGKKLDVTIRSVIIGTSGVSMVYQAGDGGVNSALRDQYFNSLELK